MSAPDFLSDVASSDFVDKATNYYAELSSSGDRHAFADALFNTMDAYARADPEHPMSKLWDMWSMYYNELDPADMPGQLDRCTESLQDTANTRSIVFSATTGAPVQSPALTPPPPTGNQEETSTGADCLVHGVDYESPYPLVLGSAESAGYDVCAAEDVICPARGHCVVSTGLSFKRMPPSTHAEFRSRSGLAFKQNIEAFEGVIDNDYCGELKVLLRNYGDVDVAFHPGDRVAQLLFIDDVHPIRAKVVRQGERGAAGFGSSGL